jgi:hypothetical protein
VQLTQVPSTPSEASALTAMISKSTTDWARSTQQAYIAWPLSTLYTCLRHIAARGEHSHNSTLLQKDFDCIIPGAATWPLVGFVPLRHDEQLWDGHLLMSSCSFLQDFVTWQYTNWIPNKNQTGVHSRLFLRKKKNVIFQSGLIMCLHWTYKYIQFYGVYYLPQECKRCNLLWLHIAMR